jgi:predicted homoserine dehydrogenase-like protein
VETVNTILAAALHGVATGASEYLPRYDVVLKAARDLRAGETIEEEKSDQAYALMIPAVQVKDEAPLPEYMAFGNRLTVDVTKGTVITRGMVALPQDSVLRSLRVKQDEYFL